MANGDKEKAVDFASLIQEKEEPGEQAASSNGNSFASLIQEKEEPAISTTVGKESISETNTGPSTEQPIDFSRGLGYNYGTDELNLPELTKSEGLAETNRLKSFRDDQQKHATKEAERKNSIEFRLSVFDPEEFEKLSIQKESIVAEVAFRESLGQEPSPELIQQRDELVKEFDRQQDTAGEFQKIQFYEQIREQEPDATTVGIYERWLQQTNEGAFIAIQSQRDQGELDEKSAAQHTEKALQFKSEVIRNRFGSMQNTLGEEFFKKKIELEQRFSGAETIEEQTRLKAEYDELLSDETFSQLVDVGKDLEALQSEAKEYLNEFPIYRKEIIEKQTKQLLTDENYKNQDWVLQRIFDIDVSLQRVLSKATQDILTLPRTLSLDNEFGWTDKWARTVENVVDTWMGGAVPSNLERGLIEDVANVQNHQLVIRNGEVQSVRDEEGYVIQDEKLKSTLIKEYQGNRDNFPVETQTNYDIAFPKFLQMTGDMGMLMLGAGKGTAFLKGLGLSQKTSQAVALSGAVTTQVHNQAYNDAVRNNLSPSEASKYAWAVSGSVALIAQINPQYFVFANPRMLTDVTRQTVRSILNGTSQKDAFVQAGSFIVKQGLREAGEETAEIPAETMIGALANNMTNGRSTFDLSQEFNEYTEAAVMGFVGGATFSPLGLRSRSRMNKEAMRAAVFNPDGFRRALSNQIGNEFIINGKVQTLTPEIVDQFRGDFNEIVDRVGQINEVRELNIEEQIFVTELTRRKLALERQNGLEITQDLIRDRNTDEIIEIDKNLNGIMNKSEADPYYELDGNVLSRSDFFQAMEDPEFIARAQNADIEFRVKNDKDAIAKINNLMQEEVVRKETTSEGGKFTMKSTSDGLQVRNNETGNIVTRKDAQFEKTLAQFKSENVANFRKGKRVADNANIELDEAEVDRLVSESSENAQEIATVYLKELHASIGTEGSKDEVIATYLSGFPFSSMKRFGDTKTLTGSERSITLHYVRKDGVPLDAQIDQLSEAAGFEINENDVIDFMNRYPGGRGTFSVETERLAALEERFEMVTGFPIDEAFAVELTDNIKGVDAMTDTATKIIETEGITAENIDNLKDQIFQGFPYTEEEFNLIKNFLQDEPSTKSTKTERKDTDGPTTEPSDQGKETGVDKKTEGPAATKKVEVAPEPELEFEPVSEPGVEVAEPVADEDVLSEEAPETAEEIEVPSSEVSETIEEPSGIETQILSDIKAIKAGTTTPARSGIGKKFAKLRKVDEKKAKELTEKFKPVFSGFKVKQARLAKAAESKVGKPVEVLSTEKEFAKVIGVAPTQTTRIQPNPIIGGKPKQLNEIIADLSSAIGRKIIISKSPSSRRSIGSFAPASTAIKIKFANDLDTTAHELGHSLDDAFGILTAIPENQLSDIDDELSKFWISGSPAPAHLSIAGKQFYRRGEGVAEWIRAFIVNPTAARSAAPKFTKWYEDQVSEDAKKVVAQFSEDVRTWGGATGHQQIMSNVEWKPERGKGFVGSLFTQGRTTGSEWELTAADIVAQKYTNQFRPFEKAFEYAMGLRGIVDVLPKNDIRITARNFLGFNEKNDDILENGLIDSENKRVKDPVTKEAMSIKWLIGAIDNSDTKTIDEEMKQTITLMVAERTVELPDKFAKQQIKEDLKNGLLPPSDVLAKYPDLLEETIKVKGKQTTLGELAAKLEGDTTQKVSRYNFENEVLTGIGGGLFKDIDIAKKALSEFEELANTDKDKHTRIKESARRYRVYSDTVLQYMADKGRISKDQLRQIRNTNTQYVALQRVIEIEPGKEVEVFSAGTGGRIGTVTQPIKKIKGSSRVIKNPYGSLLDFVYKGHREADRNDVMVAFRDILKTNRGMSEGDPINLAQIGRIASSGDANTIEIYIDGKAEFWQFDEDVFKALKGISDAGYRLPGFLTALPKILRWSVTNFPIFGVRNWIRDTQNRIIISRASSGLKEFVGSADDITRFKLFGGGQAGYYIKDRYSYYQKMQSAMKDIAKDKRFILLDPARLKEKAWDKGYRRFIEGTEQVNRVAEFRAAFKKAKEAGLDDYNANLQAAFEARDLLDFAVVGEYMQVVNQLVPFSNAAVQGLKRSIMAAKEDPKGFMLRWGMYAVVPALMQRVLIGLMGDDREKEYQQLPDFQRDLFYNIPLTDNLWMSIPKPFELGVMASGAERLLDAAFYGNEKAFDGYAGSVARSTLPIDENALWGPYQGLIQALSNYDFFRKKHIIPPQEDQLKISLRNTDRGSRIGQMIQDISGIGQDEANLDARKVDFFIRSQFSYFGNTALKLSDVGRKAGEGFEFHLGDLGVFKQTPVWSAKDVQWVIETAKKEGALRDPDYVEMNQLIQGYFNAPEKFKSKQGRVIRDYATKLRKYWEAKLKKQKNLKD